jgi:hypothetical protein
MSKSSENSSNNSFEYDDIVSYAKMAEVKMDQYEESINTSYVNIKSLINYMDEQYQTIDLTSKC